MVTASSVLYYYNKWIIAIVVYKYTTGIHFLTEKQLVLYLAAGLLGVVALFLINRNSSALVGQ